MAVEVHTKDSPFVKGENLFTRSDIFLKAHASRKGVGCMFPAHSEVTSEGARITFGTKDSLSKDVVVTWEEMGLPPLVSLDEAFDGFIASFLPLNSEIMKELTQSEVNPFSPRPYPLFTADPYYNVLYIPRRMMGVAWELWQRQRQEFKDSI